MPPQLLAQLLARASFAASSCLPGRRRVPPQLHALQFCYSGALLGKFREVCPFEQRGTFYSSPSMLCSLWSQTSCSRMGVRSTDPEPPAPGDHRLQWTTFPMDHFLWSSIISQLSEESTRRPPRRRLAPRRRPPPRRVPPPTRRSPTSGGLPLLAQGSLNSSVTEGRHYAQNDVLLARYGWIWGHVSGQLAPPCSRRLVSCPHARGSWIHGAGECCEGFATLRALMPHATQAMRGLQRPMPYASTRTSRFLAA